MALWEYQSFYMDTSQSDYLQVMQTWGDVGFEIFSIKEHSRHDSGIVFHCFCRREKEAPVVRYFTMG